MTKEIRSPNVEGHAGVQWPIRYSDFGIPSDFVIRHLELGTGKDDQGFGLGRSVPGVGL